MQQVMKAKVVSITKYRMDGGVEGATLFIEQESSNPEILGSEVMKIAGPYGLWDAAKAAGYKQPCECELVLELRRGAGMKAGFYCTALNLVSSDPKKPALFNKT